MLDGPDDLWESGKQALKAVVILGVVLIAALLTLAFTVVAVWRFFLWAW